jgi:hypothetical protein
MGVLLGRRCGSEFRLQHPAAPVGEFERGIRRAAARWPAHANLIPNGDFETNTAIAPSYNVPNASLNALLSNVTAFGPASEIDLVSRTSFGIAPRSGTWKIGMNSQLGTPNDALAFALSSSVLSGSTYDLQIFLAGQALTTLGPVEVGLSSSATSFGTLVYSASPTSLTAWSQFDTTFTAGTSASFLTLRTGSSPDLIHSFVDNVSLELVPEPSTGLLVGLSLLLGVTKRGPGRRPRGEVSRSRA